MDLCVLVVGAKGEGRGLLSKTRARPALACQVLSKHPRASNAQREAAGPKGGNGKG